ncbi:MAG: hypothetical protein MJZ00_05625 [Paludibacteraceae bacterium]|nr:hypothetical protein [Paludibacteraceae bacterium]
MKKLLTVTCGLLCAALTFAAPAKGNSKKKSGGDGFSKGSVAMDITVGAPTHSGTDFRKVMIPPLSLCIDGGIASIGSKCAISLGGMASYYLYDVWGTDHGYNYHGHYYTSNLYYDAEQHNVFAAFRGAFHFDPVDKIDIYAGLLMGGHWKIWNYVDGADYHSYYGDNPTRNKFSFGPFIGARFFVSRAFGFKAEFGADSGSGIPYAQGGITFKLK